MEEIISSKRPSGPYLLFYQDVVNENKYLNASKRRTEFRREVADLWRNLSPKQKEKYKKLSQEKFKLFKGSITEPKNQMDRKSRKGMQTRCSPHQLYAAVQKLQIGMQKDVVIELGFGGILHMQDVKIKRKLCQRLVELFEPSSSSINIGRFKIRVNTADVGRALGLQTSRKEVRVAESTNTKSFHICKLSVK